MGIYHFNARFYSPKLGRFLSADTIVPGMPNPQNLNRFAYVRNNPLRYTDPMGYKYCDEVDRYGKCYSYDDVDIPEPDPIPDPIPVDPKKDKDPDPNPGDVVLPPIITPPLTETPPATTVTSTERPPATRVAEFIIGSALIVAGLAITAGGAFLVVTGLAETSTLVGAFLGLHQIPVGVGMVGIGLSITFLGGYLMYDAITRP